MATLHLAVTVTNIRNFIPIVLEMENAQYMSWVELFKIHCRAFQVIDHIIPPTAASTSSKPMDAEKEKAPTTSQVSRERLVAIVLQWIYGTVSNDLHTILKPDSMAAQAWQALANIFRDNKNSRALYLENKFFRHAAFGLSRPGKENGVADALPRRGDAHELTSRLDRQPSR